MPGGDYVLRAEGIGKRFGSSEVLKSASLWARGGEVTCLLGRNGSGKTTLLRIAAGDLRPDYGTVSLHGVPRERVTLARVAREGLMYLPQELLVMPARRVREHFSALEAVFGSAYMDDALREARIEPLLDQRAASLSRGERVRVSLALALARRPEVLVADEPLVGLAPRDQEAFGALLKELAARGTAVVTCGHDARVLLEISDVILWCVSGTTHHLGSPERALGHGQFRRDYLGTLNL